MRLAWLLALVACGDDAAPTVREPPPPAEPPEEAHEVEPDLPPPEVPPRPSFRLRSGTLDAAGVRLTSGAAIEPDVLLEVGGEVAELAGPQDTLIALEPGAKARVAAEADLEVLLIEGSALATVAPRGGTTPAPLRIVTATASTELPGSGTVWVTSLGPSATWVASIGGSAVVSAGETTHGTLVTRIFEAGRHGSVGYALPDTNDGGPTTEDAARQVSEALPRGEASASEAARRCSVVANYLDEAVIALRQEKEAASGLDREHAAAVEAGDRERARELLSQIIDRSRALIARQETVVVKLGIAAVTCELAARADPGFANPIADRRAEALSLLGR